MNTINKRQVYQYNFKFYHSRAGVTYDEFIKILPYLDVKKVAIVEDAEDRAIIGKLTLVKKMVLRSVIDHLWAIYNKV